MNIGTVIVPTATILGWQKHTGRVCMLRPTDKHGGKLVLPGGRIILGKQSPQQCATDEWGEEVGGKGATLIRPELFAIATDLCRDVRPITFGKFQHGITPDEYKSLPMEGRYGCPDYIFVGEVSGEPWPNDGEAKEVVWVDVGNPPPVEEIGAGHDVVLAVYFHYLATGTPPPTCALIDFALTRKFMNADGIIDYARLAEAVMGR